MSNATTAVEGLERAGLALELLGEALVIEARQVRRSAEHLGRMAATANENGQPFEGEVAIQAAAMKLSGDVESGLRNQIDTIRDVLMPLAV